MRVVDGLRADHPDPETRRELTLVAGETAGPGGPPDGEWVDELVFVAGDPLPAGPPPAFGDEVDAGGGFALARSREPVPALGARALVRARPIENGGGGGDSDLGRTECDLDRTERWDPIFAAALDAHPGRAITLGFAVADPARLVVLFHAAATWLGLGAGRLAAVRLHTLATGDAALASAFAGEKARHLHPEAMALPAVDWLAPEHQFETLAGPAWRFATGPDRPAALSARQLFAVRLYTTELYRAFHRALRGDETAYLAMLPLIAFLDAGLANLPPVAARTFRGERGGDGDGDDRRRDLTAGDELSEPSYLSSSRDELHAAAMRRGYLFRIDGRTGRDISTLSEYPWEREVLFGRGLRQRIVDRDCSERAIAELCDFDTEESGPDRWRRTGR